MKITSFHPLIVTKDAASVIQVFEALGFERQHTINAAENDGTNITSVSMKDANGFCVDVAQAPVPKELSLIRMNVDDFDETVKLLLSLGFRDIYGAHPALTETSKSTVMISPSGFAINLVKHIKK